MALLIKLSGWQDYMDPAGGSWIKALIIGNPDVGKTRSASFWPKPIFADCEDGRMSLADRQVPYGRIRSSADMEGLVAQLEFDSRRPVEKRKYQTLVIDTIDKYQKVMIGERLAAQGKERLDGWADWGWLDGHMQQFVQKVLNLEMNIIVNCHYKTLTGDDDDDKTRIIGQALRLKGDVKEWLIEEFDLIGLMESYYVSEEGQRVRRRRLRWHNEPAFSLLKDRSGSLPQFTEVDFTTEDYTRVWDALMSKVDGLPEGTTVEEIETDEPVEPADADLTGGPVSTGHLPTKKVAAPVARKSAKKAVGARVSAAAEPGVAITTTKEAPKVKEETSTDVPIPEQSDTRPMALEPTSEVAQEPKNPGTTDEVEGERAMQLVAENLGGTPLDESQLPAKYCGKQPPSHASFDAVPGCGKDLIDENVAKVNLSLLRAKTMLCTDCFLQWKTSKTA